VQMLPKRLRFEYLQSHLNDSQGKAHCGKGTRRFLFCARRYYLSHHRRVSGHRQGLSVRAGPRPFFSLKQDQPLMYLGGNY
jgi:hypothetical protein